MEMTKPRNENYTVVKIDVCANGYTVSLLLYAESAINKQESHVFENWDRLVLYLRKEIGPEEKPVDFAIGTPS